MADEKATLKGDATSQLVQLKAKQAGFTTLRFTGIGSQDVEMMVRTAYTNHMVAQQLWAMCRDFGEALDRAGDEIPERFRAMFSAAILNTR